VARPKESRRVQVVFTESQWALIESLRGELGDSDSELVRNIILAWLSEKSFISSTVKQRLGLK
jgi:hypothetical protein